MDEYLSDIERLEMAKKWWKDNYKSILLGVVIAVVVVGGWRYWQYRTQSRSATASAMFSDLLKGMKAHDDAAALAIGGKIMDQYPDTPYATQSALALAQVQVTAGKLPEGEKMLQWAVDHGKDDGLKTLARLRLARVQLSAGDAKAALATLGNDDPQGFAPLFDTVRGDADVKLGDPAAARTAYQKALDAWTDQLGDKSLLKMKLDALPSAAPAVVPAGTAPAATTKAKP